MFWSWADFFCLWIGRVLMAFGLLYCIDELFGWTTNTFIKKFNVWKFLISYASHKKEFLPWLLTRKKARRASHQAFRDLRKKVWIGAQVEIQDGHLEEFEKKKLSGQTGEVFKYIDDETVVVQFKLRGEAATVRTVPISWLVTKAY